MFGFRYRESRALVQGMGLSPFHESAQQQATAGIQEAWGEGLCVCMYAGGYTGNKDRQ